MLAFMSTIVFTACSSSNNDENTIYFTLSQKSVELPYRGEVELDINGVEADDCNFKSSDDFISEATSYNGKIKIKGNHVGRAVITVSYAGKNVDLPVVIKPVEDYIGTPVIDFGATVSSIKSQETSTYNTTYEDGRVSFYDSTLPFRVYHEYKFNGGRMVAVLSKIDISRLTQGYGTFFIQVTNSLRERYKYVEAYKGRYQTVYLFTYKDKYYIGARDAKGNGGWYVYYATTINEVKDKLDTQSHIAL